MTRYPDPNITLDVNLRNPGQFFACCGVLELASRLWPASDENGWREPEGWFQTDRGRARFQMVTYSRTYDPLGEIVSRLIEPAQFIRLADDHAVQSQADRKPVIVVPFDLRLDWWLDSYRDRDKSELKVWAGQQTPERNLNALRSALAEIVGRNEQGGAPQTLLAKKWPMSGRFGFDPATSPNSLDVGFSTDE
jgi:hypothetical protein